jgi:hypothetical protein
MPNTFEEIDKLNEWVKNNTSQVKKLVEGMFERGSPFLAFHVTETDINRFDSYKAVFEQIKQDHATRTSQLALIMPLNSSEGHNTDLGALRYDLDALGKRVQHAIDISMYPNEHLLFRRAHDDWEANLHQPDALDTILETLNIQKDRLRDASHTQLTNLRNMIDKLAQRVRSDLEPRNVAAEASGQAINRAAAQSSSSHASSPGSQPAADEYQRLMSGRDGQDQHPGYRSTLGGRGI